MASAVPTHAALFATATGSCSEFYHKHAKKGTIVNSDGSYNNHIWGASENFNGDFHRAGQRAYKDHKGTDIGSRFDRAGKTLENTEGSQQAIRDGHTGKIDHAFHSTKNNIKRFFHG